LFHVRHDDKAPFTVRSGNLEVMDLGTVFNVSRDGARFSLAVAEGSVMFQPRDQALKLAPGDMLDVREDRQEVRRGKIAPAFVGAWKSGRFSFSDTPVSDILRDMQRRYGTEVVVDPALSSRKVTGIVTFTGEAQRDVPHIASLIGANWRKDGERWTLSPDSRNRP
jgi:transmembrane sensor